MNITDAVVWYNDMVSLAQRESRTITVDATLTPELAAHILRSCNADNRGVNESTAQKITKDIIADKWSFNGEAILISKEGLLNDGQHRCTGVVEANKPIRTLMTFGLDRDTRETLDQGRGRTAADYLTMQGVHLATSAASIARFLIAYTGAEGKSLGQRSGIPNSEILSQCHNNPQVAISADFASRRYKHFRRLATIQVIGFCHAVLSGVNADAAEVYLQQVCVGEDIKKSDPAFAVREALMRDRITTVERIHVIFRGWNAFRQRRKLEQSKVVGSNLPALV